MDPTGIDLPRDGRPDAELGTARRTLDDARSRLDSAVADMPHIDGDEAMATPKLLLLLVGAVRAKKRLDALEAPAVPAGGGK